MGKEKNNAAAAAARKDADNIRATEQGVNPPEEQDPANMPPDPFPDTPGPGVDFAKAAREVKAPKQTPLEDLEFQRPSMDEDPYQREFFQFDQDGKLLNARLLRSVSKEQAQAEGLQHAYLEFEEYTSKALLIVPQYWRLAKYFDGQTDGMRAERVYRIQRTGEREAEQGKVITFAITFAVLPKGR